MDSEGRKIEVVEDDMGEGMMDPINDLESELEILQRKLEKFEYRRKAKEG